MDLIPRDFASIVDNHIPILFSYKLYLLDPNSNYVCQIGTIVELSTINDNDSCEVGAGEARCLVKFGDGTHAWAPVATLKLLSAPPADDGRIMCVVCKRREGPAATLDTNAIIACDMCGRGYHAKCHSPPVDAWINGKPFAALMP